MSLATLTLSVPFLSLTTLGTKLMSVGDIQPINKIEALDSTKPAQGLGFVFCQSSFANLLVDMCKSREPWAKSVTDVNGKAVNGVVSATVTDGLDAGFYRVRCFPVVLCFWGTHFQCLS
jgi:hypothetical protein